MVGDETLNGPTLHCATSVKNCRGPADQNSPRESTFEFEVNMVSIRRLLVSKYRTVLNVLDALHRSAPQDRLRILAVEIEKHRLDIDGVRANKS